MSEPTILLLAKELANRRLSQTVETAARRCVADAIACAVAGAASPGYVRISSAITSLLGTRPEASLWASGERTSTAAALYLNSTAASADDLDDGHRDAVGHPGGAIVPAVLAVAEATGFSGDLLPAITVGYDAATRVATGRATARVPTMATGRWAAFGVAAALAEMSGDVLAVRASAMAHAGSLSPQLVHPSAAAPDGLKEGTAWSAVAGLVAHRLARAGVDSPLHLLDVHPDFDPGWHQNVRPYVSAVEQTYFKQYACCRWIHAALDLVFQLRREGLLAQAQDIESVEVQTFARSLTLPNSPAPTSLEDAHYSFPFCVALAVLGTPEDFLPLRADALSSQPVRALAARVRVNESADLSAQFPARTPVRLEIRNRDFSLTRAAATAIGDPSLPMAEEELAHKHDYLLRDVPDIRAGVAAVRRGSGPLRLRDLADFLRHHHLLNGASS